MCDSVDVLVSIMATREPYTTAFDEDVQADSNANQCPECDGRVTTNAVETVCEDCGLVIDEQRIDHGPEWRTFDEDECKRTGALSQRRGTIRGCRPRLGAVKMRMGTHSPAGSGGRWPGCDVNRLVGGSSRKPNEISHTDWARSGGWRVPSSSPIRCATRRVSCSERSN